MEALKVGTLVTAHCCPHGFREFDMLSCSKCNPEGIDPKELRSMREDYVILETEKQKEKEVAVSKN